MSHFHFFEDEQEFARAFEAKDRVMAREDYLSNAAHYLAGTLHGTDFRLFKNGGLPLMERRYGALRQEIVMSAAKKAPHRITVRVHLCHRGVKAVREKYWQPAVLAPEHLASGNAGAMQDGSAFWDVSYGPEALRHLAHYVHEWVIPWFELFERPSLAREQLVEGIPLLQPSAALEWVLYEFGDYEAQHFLESVVLSDLSLRARFFRQMGIAFERGARIVQGDDEVSQLAVIAEVFNLRKRVRRSNAF